MGASGHPTGRDRAAQFILIILGLIAVSPIAFKCIPDQIWVRAQLGDIDRLEAEARRLGGSAVVPPGGIDEGRRRISVSLELAGTGIGDADLARLTAMPAFRHVRTLSLARTGVTDRGLGLLEANPNLIAVDLSASRVSDEGLKSMATLPFLTELRLEGTEVSDAGLGALIERRGQRDYRGIDLRGTRVTADGVRSLESAFKMLAINHPTATHPASTARP